MDYQSPLSLGLDGLPGNASSKWTGELPLDGAAFQLLQQHLQNNTFLQLGRILDVVAGAYTAQVNTGLGTYAARWCSESVGGLFGNGTICTPQYGDYAVIFNPPSGMPVILGCIPPEGFSTSGVLYRALLGGSVSAFTEEAHSGIWRGPDQGAIIPFNAGRPVDVFPGDSGWCNEDGGVLGLFKGTIALLKASELAQIQAISVDDLVRIVARTYQVYHALGETHLYDDEGYVNSEISIGIQSWEPLGKDEEGQEIGSEVSDPDDGYYELEESNDPKARVQIHAGWLGDLLRIYTQTTDNKGLSRLHFDDEGRISLHSTKEVLLRRVNEIPIPHRLKDPQDPEGDTNITPSDITPYTWNETHIDGRGLEEVDFLKYTEEVGSQRRFNDYSKDWELVREEVETKADGLIHIRDDGSIVFRSNSGSTIEMNSAGDIILAPARDLLLQSGRDLIALTSGNTSIRTNKHCTLSCDFGDVRVKADSNLHMFSKTGGILLETEGDAAPVDATTGDEMKSGGIILRSKGDAPIVLDSVSNTIQLEAESNITQRTKGSGARIRLDTSIISGTASDLISFTSTEYDLETASWDVQCTTAEIKTQQCRMDGRTMAITGHSSCRIHAPNGVDVAHNHPQYEWTYVGDAHGKNGVFISKRNSPSPAVPTIRETQDIDSLVQPWQYTETSKIKFLYRDNQRVGGLYYTPWQLNEQDERSEWDLTYDKIENTLPYPGAGVTLYSYTRNTEPKSSGGKFVATTIYVGTKIEE